MSKLGVVILNWNAPDDTIRCVRSVQAVFPKNSQIVVVDNDSTDGSVEKILQAVDGVSIIQTGANLGYAGGNNRGLEEIFVRGCNYGLILNNDCTLLHTRALENIIANTDAKVGIYGLGIAESDSRGRARFRKVNKDFFGVLLGLIKQHTSSITLEGFSQVDRVSGAAMVINKLFFESVGPIDERYFLYTEEIDYCLKSRANGWGVVYEDDDYVSVVHSRKNVYERPYVWYYMYRNMHLFCKFNFVSHRLFFALMLCFVSQIKGLGKALLQGRYAVVMMMLKGFWDGLFRRTGIMR